MTAASYTPPVGEMTQTSQSRSARLAARVRLLQTKADTERVGQILMIAGGILMPLGVLLIILGWVGASRTPLSFEQNDYLISGGILGLALVVGGGFAYFAYWQTVRIRESRQQAGDLSAVLNRLESLLRESGAAVGTGVAGAATVTFVATPTGSMFHRRDCSAVANREDLVDVDPAITTLKPCRICSPLDA